MAGVKGRSGRKGWDKERDSRRLWEKAVPIVLGYLNNQHVTGREKAYVSLELIKKMLPVPKEDAGHTFLNIIYPPDWKLLDPVVGLRGEPDGATQPAAPDANGSRPVGG